MKRKKIKGFIEVLTIILALLVAFTGCTYAFNRQMTPNEVRVKNFYKLDKDSLDLAIIGSSSVYTAFSSPLAWKEQGFTSYVLATSGAPMGIMKSMLIEVRKTQKPKLILIDINGVMYNDNFENKESSLRLWIDNMPYSENKINTINELVEEKDRNSFFNPFYKYHSNWEKITSVLNMAFMETSYLFDRNNLSVSGMSGTAQEAKRKNLVDIKNYKKTQPLFNSSGKHLYDLLDYLKKNNIDNVAFINTPRYYENRMLVQKRAINQAKKVVKEYGYQFYDLDDHLHKINLDPNKDFYDHNHVNIYGQQKLTSYLAKLLQEKYDLKSEHPEDIKDKWDTEYDTYTKIVQWVDGKIKNKENIKYDIRNFKEIVF